MKRKYLMTITVVITVIIAIAVTIFINDYYRALPEAISMANKMEKADGDLFFRGDSKTGLIIYPGGKVDEKAYSVLAKGLNEHGYTVAIAKAPLHLSIFNSNLAKPIIEANPQIDGWVIIGHSLGGTSASIYAEKHPEKIKGLVFLGSYPYKDLSKQNIFALSITGSNDHILDKAKAEKANEYYPANTRSEIIQGGNHAGFGNYGTQKGDGASEITVQEQQTQTINLILECLSGD